MTCSAKSLQDTDNAIPILSAGNASRDDWSLIKAVDSSGVHVVIAADSGWHPAPIDEANSPIPHNVWIGSAGNYTTLRSWYERASVVVVPLYPVLNACGYSVIAEAMALGKPVIATRTFCHSDLLLDSQTVCYVQPLDSDAIMRKLFVHAQVPRRGSRRCGRARMERWFSNEAYGNRIRDAAFA